MPLDKATLPISLNQGIDTKSDPKQVIAGKLLLLQNSFFQTTNELIKRNAFPAIGTNTSLTSGNAATSLNNELVLSDNYNLYSYSSGQNTLNTRGVKTVVDLSVQTIVKNSYEQTAPDFNSGSNYKVSAWQDSEGGVRYSVFDSSTSQNIVVNQLVSATGVKPKVMYFSSNFVILFIDTSGPALKYCTISISTPTVLSAATTVVATVGSGKYYDASVISTRLFVAYADSGSQTSLFYLSTGFVQSSILQVNQASANVCCFGDGSNNVWVGYVTSAKTAVGYFIRDFNLSGSAVLAPTALDSGFTYSAANITGIFVSPSGTFFYELRNDNSTPPLTYNESVKKNTGTVAGSIGTAADLLRSVGLQTKPFLYHSTAYVGLIHESGLQSTYFVADSSGNIIAKIAPGNAGGLVSTGVLPEIANPSTNVYQFPYLITDLLSSVGGDVFTQTGLSLATLTFQAPMVCQTMANEVHFSGAVVSMYDGQNVVEHNFHLWPEYVTNYGADVPYFPVGGAMSSGQYQYVAVYEWTDAQGQIHQSAPAASAFTITDSGTFAQASGRIVGGALTVLILDYLGLRPDVLCKGAVITGTNIPADTTIVSVAVVAGHEQITMSNAASGSVSSGTLFNFSFAALEVTATPVQGSPNSLAGFGNTFSIPFGFVSDVSASTMEIFYPSAFRVGMTVSQDLSTFYPITSISGNLISFGSSVTSYPSGVWLLCIGFTGVCTSGSAVVTGAPTSLTAIVAAQQGISSSNFAGGTFINSVGSTSLTLSANASATGSFAILVRLPLTSLFQIGQTITGPNTDPGVITAVSTTQVTTDGIFTETASSTYTLSHTNGVAVAVDTLRLTAKTGNNPARVAIYRTVANGSIFYRITPPGTPLFNSTTVDQVAFFDATPDSTLTGNQQLYTTGGEVENTALPAVSNLMIFNNRMLAISAEDPLNIFFSKDVVANTPVQFSDLFIQRVDARDGPVIAGVQMDDKFIFLKYDVPFAMVGNGPALNGTNNDFTNPQLIPSDTGCINKKSVLLVPSGTMYQSAKGIYLLDRSLQARYIGAPVEAYNSQTVTSAQLIPNTTQARFTMSSGVILAYDYYFDQWTVMTGLNAQDSTIYNHLQTFISSTGGVYQESIGTYSENGSPILIGLKTGWLSFAKLQGFQRIYDLLILGQYYSAHTLTVQVAYDFVDSYTQTTAIPVTSDPAPYQFRVFTQRQKCEAVQFFIQESQSGSPGQGLSLSALAMEVGIKKGLNKIKAAASYG